MKVSIEENIGIRPYMEDFHYISTEFAGFKDLLLGIICDGHSGVHCAKYVIDTMPKYLTSKLKERITALQAFKDVYAQIALELANQDSGTTVVSFLIQSDQIFCANVGDSRAVIVSKNEYTQLTQDHRVDDLHELERIMKMGGEINYPYVYTGNRGLMMTRSMGDAYFKDVGVISIPHLRQYRICKNDLMIIAGSDGLFDVLNNEIVSRMTREDSNPDTLSSALIKRAITLFGPDDNVTVMAINLKEEK